MNITPKPRTRLKNIPSAAWEHPADRVALKTLQNIPALDTVLKSFFGGTTERSIRLLTLASSVRVSKKQFSRLYELHQEASEVMDMPLHELYVANNPFLNAGAVGMNKPFITLNSSVVENLDDEEVIAIIGHELGHIKSGHVLYKTLLSVLLQASSLMFNIPLTGLALTGLIIALKEWDRKSELSADRAGLLTCQNPDVYTRLLMKMAGGNKTEQMDLGEFIQQAKEYHQSDSLMDNMHKLLNLLHQTHPFPVIRVNEMINWVSSGDYNAIMNGNYKTKDFYEDVKEAANSYKEDIKHQTKPMGNFEEDFDKMKDKAKEMFDNLKKKI